MSYGSAETRVRCPFCGEKFTTVVDASEAEQVYIEDCYVCCRPITFHIQCVEGEVSSVRVSRE